MNTLIVLLLNRLGIADTEHVDAQDAGLARELAELRDELAVMRNDHDRLRAGLEEFVLTPQETRDAI